MNTLTEIFTTTPVTASSVILILTILLTIGGSYLFLTSVKWLINEKAWGRELINAEFLFEKVLNIFYEKLITKDLIRYQGHYYTLNLDENLGKWFWCNANIKKGLGFVGSRVDSAWSGANVIYITLFTSKEEALEQQKDNLVTTQEYKQRFHTGWCSLPLVVDVLYHLISVQPVTTLSILGIAVLVGSVRWLSGKLAENVNKTDTHEERISKLEEEK